MPAESIACATSRIKCSMKITVWNLHNGLQLQAKIKDPVGNSDIKVNNLPAPQLQSCS